MDKKGLLLISGLDSILAAKLLLEAKLALEILFFHIPFCTCISKDVDCRMVLNLKEITEEFLKEPLNIVDIGEEYFPVLTNPKYGYGKNINPCIDCKIFMLRKAKEYIKDKRISFLATGEVLGERPMSQNRRALDIIEEESELKGLLLRPLSGKLLPQTLPEERGWIKRDTLLDIQGRSRKSQINLAGHYGLKKYPNPAGGCLLTDPGFCRRLKDLMARPKGLNLDNIALLKIGRHYNIKEDLKLIVGRDEQENGKLAAFYNPDKEALLIPQNIPGPTGLVQGEEGKIEEKIIFLAGITASYCKNPSAVDIEVECNFKNKKSILHIRPQNREAFSLLKI